jgi:phosphate uptake regulator
MKRKVIQIANSTQLVSLPRKWALQHEIKKGDELDVREEGNTIVVSTDNAYKIDNVELNTEGLNIMIPRFIHALYKKGVEEVKITFNSQEEMHAIQKSIGKETVGFEITDQGTNFCEIKHVSGELEDFEPILKRTFLLLVSMSEQTLGALKKNDWGILPNIAFLEEANNRFTTTCRRFLNKKGSKKYANMGPIYYILEDVENLADQYKYLCNHLYNFNKKNKGNKKIISKNIITAFEKIDTMLKEFYDVFYKFDRVKLVDIAKKRKELVVELYDLLENSNKTIDMVIAHYLIVISQKIFCLMGPTLILNI